MKLTRFFSGKTTSEREKDADAFFQMGEYGEAKLEYEKALLKVLKSGSETVQVKDRLEEKIIQCKHALALEHKRTAEDLVEAGCYEEAEEILRLALVLTQQKELGCEIEEQLRAIEEHRLGSETSEIVESDGSLGDVNEVAYDTSDEDYFAALISTLPEEEQKAYTRYGDQFRKGYVRLNQGDFEGAVPFLSQALESDVTPGSFIGLELAIAHMNLGNDAEARLLLEGFLKDHPDSLRTYQLLCEIYWQGDAFSEAQQLLLNCPEEVRNSPTIHLLIGETMFQTKQYPEAESHYRDYLDSQGWDEGIALALAKTFEMVGSKDKARDLYGEVINTCQGCGQRVDPFIKQRYADTSLETGDHSTRILELYLGLVQEIPENRTHCFQKISTIYALNGNEDEANRFRAFAEQSHQKPDG